MNEQVQLHSVLANPDRWITGYDVPSPGRLLDLWDILKTFKVANFAALIDKLGVLETSTMMVVNGGKGGAVEPQFTTSLLAIVDEMQKICREIGFNAASTEACVLRLKIAGDPGSFNASHVESECRHLKEALLKEAHSRKFLLVDQDRSSYVDNHDIFGAKVSAAFPSAVPDICEAGNCLAAGCNTAAVFHLMCAAEYGLRALAYDRQVKVRKGPLDLATWDQIIIELEKAEQAIQNYPKTLAREAQFDFYHGAMMEFKRFKNKFRNPIMHAREHYDSNEAMSAFVHVKEFMGILASRIGEGTRTRLVWTASTIKP
jgi:hypothetical protein